LNVLLDVQERIGLERNQAWLGRPTEVLVEAVEQPRGHDHEHDTEADGSPAASRPPIPAGHRHLSGRSREGKLVHLAGDPALVGRLVRVVVEHSGPYALRGVLA
jgi:tRNA A37 methylthiotransferase MiaB